MAGTINLALSQQFDMDGEPLGGGLLYFFAAGTTTPQSAFQDQLLAILHPNPIVLDASGRVPMFYLADGNIKIRLTDDSGVVVMAADNLLVIGPSSGGGGGGGVDPNTVLQTGDIKARFGTGPLSGFLLCNGSTMGSAVSGATYAAAENQPLFEYLWSTTVLQVFAGATPSRGATANADWIANKRIVLPDLRGRTIAGLDDMGATAASRLTSTYFGASAIVLGNAGGGEKITSAQVAGHLHNLASNVHFLGNLIISSEVNTSGVPQDHTHPWGSSVSLAAGRFTSLGAFASGYDLNHHHKGPDLNVGSSSSFAGGGGLGAVTSVSYGGNNMDTSDVDLNHAHVVDVGGNTGGRSNGHFHEISGTTQDNNPGAAQPNIQPTMVMTFYIKL